MMEEHERLTFIGISSVDIQIEIQTITKLRKCYYVSLHFKH